MLTHLLLVTSLCVGLATASPFDSPSKESGPGDGLEPVAEGETATAKAPAAAEAEDPSVADEEPVSEEDESSVAEEAPANEEEEPSKPVPYPSEAVDDEKPLASANRGSGERRMDDCARPGLTKAGAGIAIGAISVGILLMIPAIVQTADGSALNDPDRNDRDDPDDDGVVTANGDQSKLTRTPRRLLYAGLVTMGGGALIGVPMAVAGCPKAVNKKSSTKKKTSRRAVRLQRLAIETQRGGARASVGLRF